MQQTPTPWHPGSIRDVTNGCQGPDVPSIYPLQPRSKGQTQVVTSFLVLDHEMRKVESPYVTKDSNVCTLGHCHCKAAWPPGHALGTLNQVASEG